MAASDAVYYVTGPASVFIRVPAFGAGPYKDITTLKVAGGAADGRPDAVSAPMFAPVAGAVPVPILNNVTTGGKHAAGARFLGHCEVSPEPKFDDIYKEVKSSTSGEGVSDDKVFLGQTAKVELALARFNWTVANVVTNSPRHGRFAVPFGVAPLGAENYLDRGLLMIRNGMTFEMWIRHEFYNTPNSAAYPDMPIGWYFPACTKVGQYPGNLTRDTTKMGFFIEPQNVPIGTGGGWFLYSQDPKWFDGLPPHG